MTSPADTLSLFVVWVPGTGLILHRLWLAWRRRSAKYAVRTWTCSISIAHNVPKLTPDQVVQLMNELRSRARAVGELP